MDIDHIEHHWEFYDGDGTNRICSYEFLTSPATVPRIGETVMLRDQNMRVKVLDIRHDVGVPSDDKKFIHQVSFFTDRIWTN